MATIGNFDGVHRGHRRIFAQVKRAALEKNLPASAVTFEPLPHEYFAPDQAVPRLSTMRDKVQAMSGSGIDNVLFLRFNKALSSLQPESFIEQILVQRMRVKHLVVGDDFRFGHKRKGDFELLQRAGQQHGFSVVSTETISMDGDKDRSSRISSSAIRGALTEQDCGLAEQLLGHPYQISGRVVKGQQLGRTLGFPTANVCLKTLRPALRGVFAVTAKTLNRFEDRTGNSPEGTESEDTSVQNTSFCGVANLGERPTVDGKRLLLEVNIFDANPDLYGQLLSVSFHRYIRGEKKFASLDELKQAIQQDALQARDYFNRAEA